MNKYNKADFQCARDDIKDKLTVFVVWERIYGSIPQKWSSCRCPWREDKHPSFWVRGDGRRWFDHGTGETGDIFDFYGKSAGCDSRQAFLDLLAMAGGENGLGSVLVPVAEILPTEPKKQYHPPLRVPSAAELLAISTLRSIGVEPLRVAVARGFLWTAEVKGSAAFVITDKSRKSYVARRLDGSLWDDGAKSRLLAGSQASWPIGCRESKNFPAIVLCEGGPDFLAAFGHAWASGVEPLIAPVCMSSAALDIAEEALPLFAGKRVRIFSHNDRAGAKAADRWSAQFTGVAVKVDRWRFGSDWIQVDGQPVKDLNDLLRIDYDCWDPNVTVIDAVMDF